MKTKLQLIAFMFVVGLVAAACTQVKLPGASSAKSSGSNSTATSAQPSSDPREDIKQAFLKLNAAKSWRCRLTTPAGRVMQIEFATPDRFHTKGEGSSGEQFAPPEMIIIGKNTFMKMGSMPWRQAPANMSIGEMVQARRPDVAQEMTKYQDIKFAGNETLEGASTFVYQFKRKDDSGQVRSGKMWIGASDGLPRRLETEDTESEAKATAKPMIVTYSDYNADIRIEPPI